MELKKRLKIGILTSRDSSDKLEWSGSMYYMSKALQDNVGEVIPLGPYKPVFLLYFLKIINKISLFLTGKKYNFAHSTLLSKQYGRKFRKIIRKERPDIVLAISSVPELAYLDISIPCIALDDISFTLLVVHYPNYKNLLPCSIKEGERITKRAYDHSKAIIFSSDWARDSAIDSYGLKPAKVHIVSFGANFDRIPSREEALKKESGDVCKLLFLGTDWTRKGGDIAYHAMRLLIEQGMDVELTVCGCLPPPEYNHPAMKVIPFLNKNKSDDFEELYKLFLNTHFLIIPTRNDCTPIVFCEANAFGIPVISTDVGGVASVISNGVNGILLNAEDGPERYAERITGFFSNKDKYLELVLNSRKEYENRLNWDSWSTSLNDIFNSVL